MPDPSTLLKSIPPTDEIRRALARSATEAALLRQLLRFAVAREREAERLARIFPSDRSEAIPCA
jgi:hypothetical protein